MQICMLYLQQTTQKVCTDHTVVVIGKTGLGQDIETTMAALLSAHDDHASM